MIKDNFIVHFEAATPAKRIATQICAGGHSVWLSHRRLLLQHERYRFLAIWARKPTFNWAKHAAVRPPKPPFATLAKQDGSWMAAADENVMLQLRPDRSSIGF